MSRSLNDILEQDEYEINGLDADMHDNNNNNNNNNTNHIINSENFIEAAEGMCVECGDQPSILFCEQCLEEYCQVCYQAMHKRGKRKAHTIKPLREGLKISKGGDDMSEDEESDIDSSDEEEVAPNPNRPVQPVIPTVTTDGLWFEERAKFIPMRLTLSERKYLRLVEAALQVSDYTDKVDVMSFSTSKAKRVVQQLKEICAILCGVTAAIDFKEGQQMVADRDFAGSAEMFQKVFEIARRHKIMNPEKMRTAYGKMVYLLQDSISPDIQELIKFSMGVPVLTVYSFLQEKGCGKLLHDPLMSTATKEIVPDGKERYEIQTEIKQKEKAIKILSRNYSSGVLPVEVIERCIYSIGDNHSFLRGTRDPIDNILQYLVTYFSPDKIEDGYSLAISAGVNGARLTHNHARQFHYVKQSLSLWREVAHEMFKLWILAEQDLLDATHAYQLKYVLNGYGNQDLVKHLPRDVPNALMFIDKYTQIPRILNPVVIALRTIKDLMNNAELRDYIEETFGGIDRCKKDILCDFFKYAFDGSGADNFFDAGSCIDGRLTSAWHWCSQIDKKPFYHMFLLTGFTGFDGQF